MNQKDVVEYLENWLAIEKAKLQPDPPTKAPKEGEECLVLCPDGTTMPTTFHPTDHYRYHQAYLASGHLVWGPDMDRDAEWKQEQFRRVPQGPPPFKKGQRVYALFEDGSKSEWTWVGSSFDHTYYRAGGLFGTAEERDEEAKRRGF